MGISTVEVHDSLNYASGGSLLWEAEDSSGDSRKSKAGEVVIGRKPQNSGYRIQKLLVLLPLAPDGSDGVDNMVCLESACTGRLPADVIAGCS